MKQEDKKLLLKDLCARLPYGIIASVRGSDEEFQHFHILGIKYGKVLVENSILRVDDFEDVEVVKPYLRPMSSMTEEEREELGKRYVLSSLSFEVYKIHQHKEWYGGDDEECTFSDYLWLIDWLNAHHFDYRGLIEKGLALEAPERMYKEE